MPAATTDSILVEPLSDQDRCTARSVVCGATTTGEVMLRMHREVERGFVHAYLSPDEARQLADKLGSEAVRAEGEDR